MRLRITLLIFLSIALLSSCGNNEKAKMIAQFDKLYTHNIDSEYDQVIDAFDEESKAFITELVNAKHEEFEEIYAFSKKHKIINIGVKYAALANSQLEIGNQVSFIEYLNAEFIGFFSFQDLFFSYEPKSRIGAENFVTIYRDISGAKQMSWTKFNKDAQGEYKLNLLYTLQLEDDKLDKYNKNLYKGKTHDEIKYEHERIFNTYLRTKYDNSSNEKYASVRKSKFFIKNNN